MSNLQKKLIGIACVILLGIVLLPKAFISKAPRARLPPKVGQTQANLQIQSLHSHSLAKDGIVVSNGVIVVDTREKIPPSSPDYKSYLLERKRVAERGADSRFTLHVVDQDGKAVSDAEVNVLFPFNGRQGNAISGKTDVHGIFSAEDRTTGEPMFSVTKSGYYKTSSKFGLLQIGTRYLKDGRWMPWDPMIHVTLKEIRKPIPMITKKAKIKFPKKNQPFGFDFVVADLVEPYGKGKQADIMLMSYGDKPFPLTRNYSETLVIKSNNSVGGFIRKKKDNWSVLLSDNEAPEDGYRSELRFFTDSKEGKPVVEENLKEDDYIIFRTRIATDENGDLKVAHYGKIYGPLTHGINSNDREGAGATITYYFNPTPNDRNLEFDGKSNLFTNLTSLEMVYAP